MLSLSIFVAVIVIARKYRQYFNVRCFDPRCWEMPGRRKLVRTATVSLVGLAVCLLICPALNMWLWQFGTVAGESHPQAQLSKASLILLLLFIVAVVPLEEWVIRRGLLEVVRSWKGPAVGVLVPAVAFGLLHTLDIGATFLTSITPMVAGIILGVVYLWGGFLASNLTHLGYNVTIFILFWG